MPAAPYIPPRDIDFDQWLDNFSTLIAANPTQYGVTAADATVIVAAYTSWSAAYITATTPSTRTTPAIAQKDAQRAASEATVRPYAQRIARNQGIDPQLVTELGLNLPNSTRPPVPAPTTAPALILVSATYLVHTLATKDTTLGGTKKKPTGAIGMELYRSVGTVQATDPLQATYVETWTKSPNISNFAAGQQGKICTYWGRYVTRAGPGGKAQAGPWSDPLTAYVM